MWHGVFVERGACEMCSTVPPREENECHGRSSSSGSSGPSIVGTKHTTCTSYSKLSLCSLVVYKWRWSAVRRTVDRKHTPRSLHLNGSYALYIQHALQNMSPLKDFNRAACVASSGGGLHARLDLFAGRSDQQRQFNCRCSHALTRVGTERRVASRSRSSFPTLEPVDYGPFHPRNHHAWTLPRLLWPPSQGYFCPCETMSRFTVRRYNRLRSKRTRVLPPTHSLRSFVEEGASTLPLR
jgi:hypothetical protein